MLHHECSALRKGKGVEWLDWPCVKCLSLVLPQCSSSAPSAVPTSLQSTTSTSCVTGALCHWRWAMAPQRQQRLLIGADCTPAYWS